MIRIIAIIAVILMPVISVSTTTSEQESVMRSLDLIDETAPDGNFRSDEAFAVTTTVRPGN